MVKRTLLVLLCSLVWLGMLSSLAYAADEGPYVSVQAGATWVEDADLEYDGIPSSLFTTEAEFDTGFNVGAAAGYDFGTARLEAEIAYRHNEFDEVTGSLVGIPYSLSTDGDASATSFMVNGYWDIDTASPVTPYLGAGIGVAEVSINDLEVSTIGDFIDDDDTVFAYQFAAGVSFELTPAILLDLGYRYFATDDAEMKDVDNDKFEVEYISHSANLGIRFMF